MDTKRILLLRMPSPALQKVSHPVHCYPPLTLKYIQSILKQKTQFDVNLIDGWIEPFKSEELLKKAILIKPDIMVISSNFVNPSSVLTFLNQIKYLFSNLFIIAIGPDVTWSREKFLFTNSPVDVIIPGDAEKETPTLIIELCSKEIARTQARDIYKKRFQEQGSLVILDAPDSLPFPEFSKKELLKYSFIYPVRLNKRICCGYIMTSWGCSHHCIFCSQAIRKSYGSEVRLRSPENVVDEVEYLIEKGVNFISFEDDNFTSSKDHVTSICQELRRRNLRIKWAAQGRTDEVDSYLLEEMKAANCDFLQFGIESGSEKIVYSLKKTDHPEEWIPRSREVFERAREIGIATCALFIIGNPDETIENVESSIALAATLKPALLKLHFFSPYPGSQTYRIFSERLGGLESEDMYHHKLPSLNFSQIDLGKMIELRKRFYKKIYLNPTFIIRHLFRYFPYYLHNLGNLRFLVRRLIRLFLRKR